MASARRTRSSARCPPAPPLLQAGLLVPAGLLVGTPGAAAAAGEEDPERAPAPAAPCGCGASSAAAPRRALRRAPRAPGAGRRMLGPGRRQH